MTTSLTFLQSQDYPPAREIQEAEDHLFSDHGEVPGVARSDIDLARITPGAKQAEDEHAVPYAVMHLESRNGGQAVLRWVGDEQTRHWLSELVGGDPLLFATTLRRCGPELPAPAVPVFGTSDEAETVWAVTVRLDEGDEPLRYTVEEQGAESQQESTLGAGEAVAIRHDAVRSFEPGPAGALLFEFFVVADIENDSPPLPDWDAKKLAARRRLMGLAERAAEPARADEIGERFEPALRTDDEELPLIRILAPTVPPTKPRIDEDREASEGS
jgi:hypothetical protein